MDLKRPLPPKRIRTKKSIFFLVPEEKIRRRIFLNIKDESPKTRPLQRIKRRKYFFLLLEEIKRRRKIFDESQKTSPPSRE